MTNPSVRLCLFVIGWFALLIANLLASSSSAVITLKKEGHRVSEIPNPLTDPASCGRSQVARTSVCDPDALVSDADKDIIEGYINSLSRAQIAVAIIYKINHDGLNSKDDNTMEAAKFFSTELHNTWGVGSSTSNDGILIFLSISDRVVYLSTGSGVKHLFPQHRIDGVIDNMKSDLRKGEYGSAIQKCIIQIDAILSGDSNSELEEKLSSSSSSAIGVYFSYIFYSLFFCFIIGSQYSKYREYQRLNSMQKGQAALDRLMKEVEQSSESFKFHSSSCPICLEAYPSTNLSSSSPSSSSDMESESGDACGETSKTIIAPSSSGEGSNSSSPKVDATRRPMGLQCGHTFCFSCLETYLKSDTGKSCPICRAPVDINNPPVLPTHHHQHPSPYSTGYSTSSDNSHRPCSDTFNTNDITGAMDTTSRTTQLIPELQYRAHRMRVMYPNVMTAELLQSVNEAASRGSYMEIRNGLANRSHDIQRAITSIQRSMEQSATRTGKSGSSRSFGGGSSFGGGGGGGRW